jgi:hypothetical protein
MEDRDRWNEMFVRHVTELCEIVNATLIVEQQREDVKSCIMSILVDGLMGRPLGNCGKSGMHEPDRYPRWISASCTTISMGSYGSHIRASRRMPRKKPDSRSDSFLTIRRNFRDGQKEFEANYPTVRPELGKVLTEVRTKWQNELPKFRNNVVEHPKADQTAAAVNYLDDALADSAPMPDAMLMDLGSGRRERL